jgi:hypothetical protein
MQAQVGFAAHAEGTFVQDREVPDPGTPPLKL